MCDTVVAFGKSGVWLAKNSDREPGEAQVVERQPRIRREGVVRCTHIDVPDCEETLAIAISRPFWMWGAEMGVNEKGVAIGNEAVFTRQKLDPKGLTGMDLVRLSLERASTSYQAVEVITRLLREYGQGGRMGYRHAEFSYSSSFLIADGSEAWVLETAGRHFAAERVTSGVRSISNALSIRAADETDERSGKDFRGSFDRPLMSYLAGASRRQERTRSMAHPDFAFMATALRDHAERDPRFGFLMSTGCAHAAPWPTRSAGQTAGSMIVKLSAGLPPDVWLTGTSSPCLSVFKPVRFGPDVPFDPGPAPGPGFDPASLWWRHERLHREMLRDWSRFPEIRYRADDLERRSLEGNCQDVWSEHRMLVDAWRSSLAPPARRWIGPSASYWRRQNALDGIP